MTLLELCEPLFQYICRLNRLARAGADIPASQIRSEIKSLLDQMRAKASEDAALRSQFEVKDGRNGRVGMELAMVFFADFMIRDSGLQCAQEWNDLAEEYDELGGDEKFFDLLDETLAEHGPAADERIAVFYTCLGLGFSGWFADQPEFLRRKMIDCGARLRGKIDAATTSRLCDDAYEHTDKRELDLPPGRGLIGIGIAMTAIVLVLLVGSVWLYHLSHQELSDALDSIIAHDQAKAEGEGGS